MEITGNDLTREYINAKSRYPYLVTLEEQFRIPYMLLFAVGSRETNLTNEVGDNGHGHGMFQLDDRSHVIPPGFDTNVSAQAKMACEMLNALIKSWNGNLAAAVASYNCGSGNVEAALRAGYGVDYYTAHGDYAADVLARRAFLSAKFPRHNTGGPLPPQYHHAESYVVRDGDTLSAIAEKFHVPGGWPALYDANRSIVGGNPNFIRPGMHLTIPMGNNKPVGSPPEQHVYVVQPGDSLSSIATRFKLSSWTELYHENQRVIGDDPNKIYPGQKLIIP